MVPSATIEINADIGFARRKMIEKIIRSGPIDEIVLHSFNCLEERIDVVGTAAKCLGHGPDQHDWCDGVTDGGDRGDKLTSGNSVDKLGERLWRVFHPVFIVGYTRNTIVEQRTFAFN